nr:ribose-phosphate pyrophosphokinase [Streptomyces sp. NBRC 110035]
MPVFSGSAHPELAAEACAHLGVPLSSVRSSRFANDSLEVQLQANCRERDVFLVQPLVRPVQEHLVELLLMCDPARGASASRITVVMPHYSYARSDKKDVPRISMNGRLVADLLVAAGASRVLAMTLHAPQVRGFFSVPVDHLHALRELASHFRQYELSRATVVSPDLGNAKEAAAFARLVGAQVAAGAKQRFADDRVRISSVIGEIAGRDVVVPDDEIAKGSTVLELLDRLRELGPRSIRVACTHGLFAAGALKRLSEQPDVLEIVCIDTVPVPAGEHTDKLRVLSIAPALAEAVRRIHNGESVSDLFDAPPAAQHRLPCRPLLVIPVPAWPRAGPGPRPGSVAEAAAGPGR